METQPRFDLNAAIENWRNELAAQLQLTPDDRRELEKHLADTMAELRQRGLNDEESFWLARRRIGQPQQLAEEFVKTNPGEVWRERIFWMLFLNLILFVWNYLTSSVAMKFYSGENDVPWVDTAVGVISGIFPLVIGIKLARGKWLKPASKIDWVLENRGRFVAIAIPLGIIASAFMALSTIQTVIKIHPTHGYSFVLTWITFCIMNIISVVIILFFMPKENLKSSTVGRGRASGPISD